MEQPQSPIPDRIRTLRESLGLSRQAFADALSTSPRTIQAIEQKGQVPRSDLISKISEVWPQYTLWITSGTNDLPIKQDIPSQLQETENWIDSWRVIQQLTTSNLDQCAIKPEWFDKIIFLQGDDIDDLMALIVVRVIQDKDRVAIKVGYGEMTFESPAGIDALNTFKGWINNNRPDLIKTAKLFLTSTEKMDSLCYELEISQSDLSDSVNDHKRGLLIQTAMHTWRSEEKLDYGNYF